MENQQFRHKVVTQIESISKVFKALKNDEEFLQTVSVVAKQIIEALKNGKKLLLFGNGGSAADAQHIAAEFVGRYTKDRKAYNALALSTNTSAITAIGNDYSFDEIFSRQVEAIGNAGDIAIGISTSGTSRNVIKALRTARSNGLTTIGMTGENGDSIKKCSDYCICIPSDETPRIQEGHILVGHILAALVEEELFGN